MHSHLNSAQVQLAVGQLLNMISPLHYLGIALHPREPSTSMWMDKEVKFQWKLYRMSEVMKQWKGWRGTPRLLCRTGIIWLKFGTV